MLVRVSNVTDLYCDETAARLLSLYAFYTILKLQTIEYIICGEM